MTSHTPTPQNTINVSGSWSAGHYQRTTGYTYVFYWQGSSNNDTVPRSILYNNTTRKWEDNGVGVPTSFDGSSATSTNANPQSVTGYQSSTAVWSFTNPYYDSTWTSGPNPTSTEEVAVLNGSWSSLADGTHVYTIASNSPTSSTANGLYDIRVTNPQTGVSNRMFQPNSIIHTFGTATPGYISVTTNDGLYELIHIGSSLNSFPITVRASMTVGRKKVFSNFW